jgi:CheY-like chemotaxis protein
MKTILIIDDHEPTQALLAHVVRPTGAQIVSAATVDEGLQLARQIQPNVILMDIYLPGTKNGWDATRHIKSSPELQHIPVIIITAGGAADDEARAVQVQADGFYRKPFNMPDLLEHIRQYL